MATIPQPLTSSEIREGIAVRMVAAASDLDEPVRLLLKNAIAQSLTKTCSLNSTAYSKFSAKWKLDYEAMKSGLAARWWVDYALDDFGRVTSGGIGGNLGLRRQETVSGLKEGTIEEMPPDKFRRETAQPVPAATVIKPADPNANQPGMSHAKRNDGRRRDV